MSGEPNRSAASSQHRGITESVPAGRVRHGPDARQPPTTLRSQAVVSAAALLGGTAASFGLQLVLARWLGREDFGVYTLALSWTLFTVLLARQGLDTAVLRFIPILSREEQAACLTTSRVRVVTVGIAIALLGGALIRILHFTISPSLSACLLPLLLAVPVLALAHLEAGFLQAIGRISASRFPILVGLPAFPMVMALLLNWTGWLPGHAVVAGSLYLFSALITLGLLVRFRRFRLPIHGPVPRTAAETPWFPAGRALLLSSSFNIIMSQADILMVGVLMGTGPVGPYAVATRIARFLALPLIAGNAVLAPRFSELHNAGRTTDLQRLVRKSSLAMTGVSLGLLAFIFLFQGPILTTFGPGFEVARKPLMILLIGQSVNVLMGSVGYLLMMTGGHGTAARILAASTVLNLTANGILIPTLGVLGAAIATTLTITAWNLTMYFSVRSRLGIRPSFF